MLKATKSTGMQSIGAAAVSGGTLLTASALFAAAKPTGCIGDQECAIRPMRESGALVDVLLIAGLLFIAVACVGLGLQATRAGLPGAAWWRRGSTAVAIGVALLFLGGASTLFSEDLAPFLVVPGLVCLAVGGLVVGVLLLRSAILPSYASALLIFGTLALPASNGENWRVLLMVPFGVAWVVAGYALLRERVSQVEQRDLAKLRPPSMHKPRSTGEIGGIETPT